MPPDDFGFEPLRAEDDFGFKPIKEEGSDWGELNAGMNTRPIEKPKDEGFFPRLERIRKKKLEDARAGGLAGIGKKLLDMPVDPFSQIGRAYREAREVFTDAPETTVESWLPNAGAASVAKGAIDFPQGVGNKILNRVAPDSRAANISNRFSQDINDTYTQNFTPSAYGEGIGNMLPTIGLPVVGKGLGGMAGTGAYVGAVQSQGKTTDAGGWTPETSAEVNDQSVNDLLWGAGLGAAIPSAPEVARRTGQKLSPYMVNIKDYLKKKSDSLDGAAPFRAFIDDIMEKKGVSNTEGNRRYDALKSNFGSEELPAKPLVQQLDDFVAELRTRAPEDPGLISHLESIANKYRSKQTPSGVLDAKGNPLLRDAASETPQTIESLINTYRNIGNQAGQAVNTAGQTVQRTTTGEEIEKLTTVKALIRKMVGDKNQKALDEFDSARGFWREGDANFTAPAEFKDPKRGGKLYQALTNSDRPDTAVSGLMKNKSEVVAEEIGKMTTPNGRNALQVKLLEDAQKVSSVHPDEWIKRFTTDTGELTPMAKVAFQGEERKALEGMIKLKRLASGISKTTNVLGAAGVGAMAGGAAGVGAGAAGAGLAGTALWARRGTWLGTWSSPIFEKLMNNRFTRKTLAGMAKLPPGSPGFAKAAAVLEQEMKNSGMDEE